jgi:hypothetical protein
MRPGLPFHTKCGFFLDSEGCFSIVFAWKSGFLSTAFSGQKAPISAFIIGLHHHKGDQKNDDK